jgi:hypothetical protein
VKVVESPNGKRTRFALELRSHTIGRASQDNQSKGLAARSAYLSDERSASDLGTSSPITMDR